MPATNPKVRLRQAVIVAAELELVANVLRSTLRLREPFRDPGVGEFGLENVVFAIGDCFIEVVSPLRAGTAAGRYLQAHDGDGGYMLLFDLEDLTAARARVAALGVRVVWQIDLPDISGTHLHPADMRGAIVSLDRSQPYGSWRWGGPQWTGQRGQGAQGRLAGVEIAVADPAAVAARWSEVLGVASAAEADGAPLIALEDGWVRFTAAVSAREEGLVEIAVETAAELPGGAQTVEIGGVRIRRLPPS